MSNLRQFGRLANISDKISDFFPKAIQIQFKIALFICVCIGWYFSTEQKNKIYKQIVKRRAGVRACSLRCWRCGIFRGGLALGKYCNKSQRVRKNQQERSGCAQKKIHASAMMRHATTGMGIVFFGNGFGKAKILYLCDEGVFVTQAPQAIARA